MRVGKATGTVITAAALLGALAGCGQPAADDPTGVNPGRLEEFIEMGPVDARIAMPPAELGTDSAQTLSAAVERAVDTEDEGKARAALADDPEPGRREFAFVKPGCREDGARLLVGRTIDAELTGGENVNCAVAVYFLVTLSIATEDLPDGATLATD